MEDILETDDNFEIVACTFKSIYDQTCRSCGLINRIIIFMPDKNGKVVRKLRIDHGGLLGVAWKSCRPRCSDFRAEMVLLPSEILPPTCLLSGATCSPTGSCSGEVGGREQSSRRTKYGTDVRCATRYAGFDMIGC
ncbi:hypothetical protein AK812_SmicGene36019 [Symbiodinium microadriaticum]|uniref:Uncharacterized protein n=1 Tax=Symbiodinium microadriaticum TaxID=2951 RepID=A0A1Q9CK03_SYMMI|nr:hypothetical protein AK812_SmicGene36019 [Symbiodinium microadriaticum]